VRQKPAQARVRVTVERQASGLAIVVEDDGRGLDPRRLKQAAIERGLLTPSKRSPPDRARPSR
jgi:two-component system chemotaxis sensor kinase CheA